MRARRLAVAALALGLAAASAAPAGAQSPGRPGTEQAERAARALALAEEGQALYERGEYRAAIAKLEEALALDPDKDLVFNLAVLHEKLADVDQAERYYRRYLEMETSPKLRERVQSTLKRIEGAKKELASARAPEPPPPPATQTAPAPPPPPPEPEPQGRRIDGWVMTAGGVAAGAAIVGTVFGISALGKDPGDAATTGPTTRVQDLEEEASTAHTHAILADVSFLVAALAGGAAVLLYLRSGPAAPATASGRAAVAPSVSLGVGPARGVVRVRF